MPPARLSALGEWMATQRWYAGKGHVPRLTQVGGWRYADPQGQARVEALLVRDDAASTPVLYHVPLTYREAPLAGADAALVPGVGEAAGPGWRGYDGPHDPAYVRALLGELSTGAPALVTSSVLGRQQSHTSVVCSLEDTEPVLVKVFRTVSPGPNPDVELPAALFAAGFRELPRPRGSVEASWDPAPTAGYLASASTFVPDAEDAWALALDAAGSDRDFTAQARQLGETTARLHRALAAALPTSPATPADAARLRERVRARLADAASAAPQVDRHRDAVEELLASVDAAAWPPLQRVHGDYHLGQVLHAPDGRWLVVDFEGEPLRPLGERTRPDLAAGDVAGMLRSFDYAAGMVEAATTGTSRRGWALACRRAFLRGYGAPVGPAAFEPSLLAVLEVDKALYEVGYEARHRPSWVAVPVQALERLLGKGAS